VKLQQSIEIQSLLAWQLAMGVDETIADEPTNWLNKPVLAPVVVPAAVPTPAAEPPAQPIQMATAPAAAHASLAETIAKAQTAASAAQTLDALREAIISFDGCSLKKAARNTVFSDGNPSSDIMLIGDMPDADEDRQGRPFCGASGELLTRMLSAIGLNRTEECYLATALPWRPPGNRTPTPDELAICQPFLERHITLMAPKLLILCGNMASKTVLNESRNVMKLRGQALHYGEIPARVLIHPSQLLRKPLEKRLAWQDLLEIKAITSNR
jgi:uracil-DNA glycosylase family 4